MKKSKLCIALIVAMLFVGLASETTNEPPVWKANPPVWQTTTNPPHWG